ncbi:hypothetical protein IU427_17290 [Nocardia beijingensis]|uniref:hypothetical protein n=1 Tax=Nocardia beijingensis TaxID=95162 RepID=UPI001893F83C|nr:hypothetical protein [Nocardia beijingensis]MBF6466921.1 hypothetical protein [Nocardia beijingensis]
MRRTSQHTRPAAAGKRVRDVPAIRRFGPRQARATRADAAPGHPARTRVLPSRRGS